MSACPIPEDLLAIAVAAQERRERIALQLLLVIGGHDLAGDCVLSNGPVDTAISVADAFIRKLDGRE